MPPKAASFVCALAIFWLFREDRKRNGGSWAMYLPLCWAFIIASKPISLWFGYGNAYEGSESYLEGSPFDRIFFLSLIVGAWVVVAKRGVNWGTVFQHNRWLCWYFLYLGVSALWSDYPFGSFKRWIKDSGNVVMVLVVLTEKNPMQAVKSLLGRCAFLVVLLSVLLIKYYPDLGRYYDRWTYQPHFGGVTTDKNLLGMSLFVCALSLMWMAMEAYPGIRSRQGKKEFCGYAVLLGLSFWLLVKAQSSTALACSVLGGFILLGARIPFVRSKAQRLGVYCIVIVASVLLLNTVLDLTGALVAILGRDLTFTGRTTIWQSVLNEDINPLFGTGFYSFWMGDRAERLSAKYHYLLNEAHNGYIETYLNSGLIGLGLLFCLFISAISRTQKEVATGSTFGALKLAFLVANLIYNITEAAFDRLDLLWFGLLLMLTQYPGQTISEVSQDAVPEPLDPLGKLETQSI
jgi:exopolysaccharide production protein ExoQ